MQNHELAKHLMCDHKTIYSIISQYNGHSIMDINCIIRIILKKNNICVNYFCIWNSWWYFVSKIPFSRTYLLLFLKKTQAIFEQKLKVACWQCIVCIWIHRNNKQQGFLLPDINQSGMGKKQDVLHQGF